MKLHRNARTTPFTRRLIVERVRRLGWAVCDAAQSVGVSTRTAYKWLARFDEFGESGLADRSSRPRLSPRRTPVALRELVLKLRERRLTAWEIAAIARLPPSTISRLLHQAGRGRLPSAVPRPPIVRYERERPGELVHLDSKKLGRIRGVGHRITGQYTQRQRGIGWEFLHVCVDDHTRLAYAEVLADDGGATVASFFARAVRWFARRGIPIERVLSDNAKANDSLPMRSLCAEHDIRRCFTRPYTPRTNGKVERLIQTLLRRWAYAAPYRSSAQRTAALLPWLRFYNHQRPHSALGMKSPITRLREFHEQRP
ncbi:MAG TPA: IS481 family transposase [Myxococcota bacterium]|nr:IS481 family transposase [Myxococcota bacterium]